jgi:hypothetical protein
MFTPAFPYSLPSIGNSREFDMADFIFIGVGLACFLATWALVLAFERLRGS